MTATKYLPSLNNSVWEKSERIGDLPLNQQFELEKSHQLAIRRARIAVEILKRPSDSRTKYDLFQRLNAGGTPANAQELRNCIMIMMSDPYYKSVQAMANYQPFRTVLAASEDQIERQRHMEYASRFLVHLYVPYDGKHDVEDYIDEGMIELAANGVKEEAEQRFKKTFDLLDGALGGNALKRLDQEKHQGRVSLAAFECIAVGVGRNMDTIAQRQDAVQFVHDRVKQFWNSEELPKFFAPGLRGTVRIQRTIPFGEQMFAP